MSTKDSMAEELLATLTETGFDKAACSVSEHELHELQAENGDISLLRTAFETDVSLTGIVGNKKASLGINRTDDETINAAAINLKTMADAASPDPAHDIAEQQPAEQFQSGIDEPDYDKMYDRVQKVVEYATGTYPTLNLRSVNIVFFRRRNRLVNSNGIDFQTQSGSYRVSLNFTSKEGTDTSSMNYTGYSTHHLDTPIHATNDVDDMLRQSTEQVRTQHIPAKFMGDLVISPHCLTTFTGFLLSRISDLSMIDGTSVYKDKLGEQVAINCLTIHSLPLSEDLTQGYFVTDDGYKAEDLTIVENGKLNTYLLSLYGSNKLDMERAANNGGCYVIDAGDKSFDDIISSVKEGIYINRFSGGIPNERGDFSGVAKNSYYIKDGTIQYPIQETTVSGNMVELLQSIETISSERLNSGESILPWVRVSGVTAS
ncbi:MAG: metallopeptidase TldD-related protein [Pseudomonadales bacterium]|jgi:PmbA protein|nr:metallopeptidase TldD-related protein [Pseudomonadales bacterium]MDP7594122.1 metallopeptidase TldD-related protein [Pseudomonadales bacterium]HJN49427.1 metallopeptidase TldD-related protein [Pseudomonadales bacterium]